MSEGKFTLALVQADKRSRFDAIKDLTPEKLTNYLDEFRAGFLAPIARLSSAVEERDDLLASVVPKSKAAVARHGFEINVVKTEDEAEAALGEAQKEVLEHFYNNIRCTSALDQDEIGGFRLLVEQMMDAKGKRYSVHNIVWQPTADGKYTAKLIHVPLWFFENTTGKMRFIAQPYGTYGEEMAPNDWLVTKGKGLMLPCLVAWMYKRLPLRDWLIYCARHGMPGIEGVTDAAEGSAEWNLVVDAVEAAASEFKWVRSRSSEIKTIDFSAQGVLPYPALIERMDRAMAAIWRGADLSTMSAGSGAGDGASLQGEESDIIEQDDGAWISEILQLKLDRIVLDLVFGPESPSLAYVKVLTTNRQNIDQELKIDEAAQRLGHPVSKKQFAERYNRPLPDKGDELLVAPVAPALPVQTAFNEAEPTLQKKVAEQFGVPSTWLAPVEKLLVELETKAADKSLTNADFLAFYEASIAKLPELMGEMDIDALAEVIETGMGEGLLTGIRESLKKSKTV
jgi:hypothetical protein